MNEGQVAVGVDYGTGVSIGAVAIFASGPDGKLYKLGEATNVVVTHQIEQPDLALDKPEPVERKKSYQQQQRELPKFLKGK